MYMIIDLKYYFTTNFPLKNFVSPYNIYKKNSEFFGSFIAFY